jgi:hypothetical protein
MSMMPLEHLWRTKRGLIHPSAWKTCSQKFAPGTFGWHHAAAGQASSEEDTV